MAIQYNPGITTNFGGTFSVQSDGLIQGNAYDDPAIRNALAGGILAASDTLPMWGGIPIYEQTGPQVLVADPSLGNVVGRATAVSGGSKPITGFSVFNQGHAFIETAQSRVPTAQAGMMVPFYRLGSGARIVVAADPSLASIEGGLINQNVSWDFTNGVLQPYDASTPTYALSTVTWSNANGGRLAVVASVATLVGGVGDWVTISGATNSGTGGSSAINTSFVVDTFTDNQNFTLAAPAAAGVFGTIAGSPVLNYGTGALPCKVLQLQVGNSKTVVYSSATGFANWNPSGAAAVILI